MCFSPQYSQKEDKYEEEIKILTDKLKEVSKKEQLPLNTIKAQFICWNWNPFYHLKDFSKMCRDAMVHILCMFPLLQYINLRCYLRYHLRLRPELSLLRGLWPSWRRLLMIWKVQILILLFPYTLWIPFKYSLTTQWVSRNKWAPIQCVTVYDANFKQWLSI